MKILFSPIGMTDPISNFHDGALLHICRFCEIDKVYMYMSKEICEYDDLDDRFALSLDKLSEHIGKEIKYEKKKRPDLEDVYLFDSFLEEFTSIIAEIQQENKDAEIYLNVSSGTPAMKSALQIISANSNYIPVQVTTPEKKSNPRIENKSYFNVDEQWNSDKDNSENTENRCTVSSNINLTAKIKKQMLISILRNYDYSGARILAESESMQGILSKKAINLINGAELRIRISNTAKSLFEDAGYKGIIKEHTELEYLLMLDIKVRRREYADFLRGITPLTTVLFEKILETQCDFKIDDYIIKNEVYGDRWDREKLERHPKALDILETSGNGVNTNIDGKIVYTSHTEKLIQNLSDDNKLKEICSKLRKSERQRNIIAHQMTEISDDKIFDKLGFRSKDILNMLYIACAYCGYCGFKKEDEKEFFESYDNLNKYIEDAVNEQ